MLSLAATLAAGTAGWYWADRDGAPGAALIRSAFGEQAKRSGAAQTAAATERQVLYWKDPEGKNDFSDAPKETRDGRPYLPVYADEKADLRDAKPAKPQGRARILYYRNPMGLPDTSPVPKKDPMGMDYVPVHEGDEEDGTTIKIAPGKLQRTGVKSEPVARRIVSTHIRAPGVVQADEHRQTVVALRFDAFIEKLDNVATGAPVRRGQPLIRLYSSALSSAAAQYLTDLSVRNDTVFASEKGSWQRLQNLGLPEVMINDIGRRKDGTLSVLWPAPRDGFILQNNVIEGMRAQAGDVLFRIADLSTVWVQADVAERDLAAVAPGQIATVKPRGYPGRTFTGKITLVYPMMNKETRTARVRIELANPENVLRPNMYADVEIAGGGEAPALALPENAVINSGTRNLVILDKGDGRFEPREVKTGAHGAGFAEIKDGVSEGDKVVVAANFLIDAESNLKAALKGLTAAGETQ
jgi:Cu(I)/Ag(I) efflux system membrane fusion protein